MHAEPGDSGTWLLDASTADMYGHLTSRSETLPLAYASPSPRVFDEIARKMNTSVDTIMFPRVIQPKESAGRPPVIPVLSAQQEDRVQAQLRERRKRAGGRVRRQKRRFRARTEPVSVATPT